MIGRVLGGRYEILEKIGEGGMAKVYKAKCRLLNRFVAVKILKEEYSKDKDFVEKFKREATAAASLSDPNIVNIFDIGSDGDTNYIILELINGKTLKQIIKENGKLSCKTAVGIAIQIAKALECAHKNNIIHRDIKPHNIMMTKDGVVKVTDFGIAKASSSVTITNSSKVMGSAHYFSPEQAKGSYVDFRTDIYSLGIVIYEMVTGKVPYDAESPVSVALKHIQEPVVPPKDINGDIPDNLNKLILKAVEKEPIKRYQNISDMLSDLRKIQNNQPINIVTEDFDDDNTRIMDAVKDTDEEESDDEGEIVKKQHKKRKLLLGLMVVILIIAAGSLTGILLAKQFNKGSAKKSETKVPYIIGMSQKDAKKAVEDNGLTFVVANIEKSDKAVGTVTDCSPKENMTVLKGSEVRVNVSGGAKGSTTIPDFKGMDIDNALAYIDNNGLVRGKVEYKFDDNSVQNIVIDQSPDPETDISKGNTIDLVVSKGPETKYTYVPSLKGKKIGQAEAILSNAGLKAGTKTEVLTDDKEKDGIIISAEPGEKTKVKEGSSVNISYYKYSINQASLGDICWRSYDRFNY